MLTVYTWTTPNGYKVPIMLEELGLPYELKPVNITKGEQRELAYLKLNPNNKVPTLLDSEGPDGKPITVFESGAILIYLAEKTGKFMPQDARGKYATIEWLMFQMASVGPMTGQANHFVRFAPEKIAYAIARYVDEVKRLYRVLDGRLGEVPYLAGDYSIADIATWPWLRNYASLGIELADYPNLETWVKTIEKRTAVGAALSKVDAAAKKAS